MTSILFVCLGNICRSPAAEAILRHQVSGDSTLAPMKIDSCGLGDWHLGQLPDARMRAAAQTRGINLVSRARLFDPKQLKEYQYILAADQKILSALRQQVSDPHESGKIQLITAYSTLFKDQEVPDPYHQGEQHFELVLDILEEACQGLLLHLKKKQNSDLPH